MCSNTMGPYHGIETVWCERLRTTLIDDGLAMACASFAAFYESVGEVSVRAESWIRRRVKDDQAQYSRQPVNAALRLAAFLIRRCGSQLPACTRLRTDNTSSRRMMLRSSHPVVDTAGSRTSQARVLPRNATAQEKSSIECVSR